MHLKCQSSKELCFHYCAFCKTVEQQDNCYNSEIQDRSTDFIKNSPWCTPPPPPHTHTHRRTQVIYHALVNKDKILILQCPLFSFPWAQKYCRMVQIAKIFNPGKSEVDILLRNISNTRRSVSSDIQTPRSELKNEAEGRVFLPISRWLDI